MQYSDEQMKKVLDDAVKTTVSAAAKKHKVSEATIYVWRRKQKDAGGRVAAPGKNGLEAENARLREALGKALVEIEILRGRL